VAKLIEIAWEFLLISYQPAERVQGGRLTSTATNPFSMSMQLLILTPKHLHKHRRENESAD
jgi:hypothetical protein